MWAGAAKRRSGGCVLASGRLLFSAALQDKIRVIRLSFSPRSMPTGSNISNDLWLETKALGTSSKWHLATIYSPGPVIPRTPLTTMTKSGPSSAASQAPPPAGPSARASTRRSTRAQSRWFLLSRPSSSSSSIGRTTRPQRSSSPSQSQGRSSYWDRIWGVRL